MKFKHFKKCEIPRHLNKQELPKENKELTK